MDHTEDVLPVDQNPANPAMDGLQKAAPRGAGARPFLSLAEAGHVGALGDADTGLNGGGGGAGGGAHNTYERTMGGYAAPTGTLMSPTTLQSARTSMIGGLAGVDFRSRQLALLGPMRPQPTKVWRRKFVKLLVVGDSGLGKTTLISALLSKPGEQLQVHDGTNTPLGQFLKDPDSLLTRVTWKDEQDKVVWVFRVQDTPGYGDDEDIARHISLIREHIHVQNRKWLAMESAKDRCVDLVDVEDTRVDVCLYCLPPHRLRQNDVRYMAELSKHVPIIPVIMKADTMTIHEAQRFRQEVVNRLQNPVLAGVKGKIDIFHFSPATLERAGLPSSAATNIPPFVVIASNDINQAALNDDPPTYWPERSYKWGTAEAFNPDHSDLLFLRALLMAEALEEVCVTKRQRYEEWRAQELSTPFLKRWRSRILRLLLASVAPAAAVAFAAVHDFDRAGMGRTLRERGGRVRDALPLPRRGSRGSTSQAAIEEAPAPAAPQHHQPSVGALAGGAGALRGRGGSSAAAALREAEEALRAAEAAQQAALEELQRAQRPQKRGWW